MQNALLSIKNVTKTYPGVIALNDFSIEFAQGEVHALLGENGAGKSTLIKIISGAVEPDSGQMFLDGKDCSRMTPHLAREMGVKVIYQEFSLVEPLSVAKNVFLGENGGVFVKEAVLRERAAKIFAEMNVSIDPVALVRTLSPAKKQLVEIAKAISANARILIMDEPSAPLSASEVETMFAIIEKLKSKGVTIIYISHRIEELFRISDRVTVMRDGCFVKTLATHTTSRKELIDLMVGRELKEFYPDRQSQPGEVALDVRRISGLGNQDISFQVRKGEILGVAGLVGSGRTELVSLVYGAQPKDSGEVWVAGKKRAIHSPEQAIEAGIGLIPEDRKLHGCIIHSSVRFNISLSVFNRLARFLIANPKAQRETAVYYVEKFNIKTPSLDQRVANLSGGNQQKVVLSKTLAANTNILIFDEPTRGIDVGAKQEIYKLMVDLANQGKALIMISSDMEELLGMADRLIVLCEGKLMGEIPKEKFDQRAVIELASGHH